MTMLFLLDDDDKDYDYYDCADVDSAGGGRSISDIWGIYIIFMIQLA